MKYSIQQKIIVYFSIIIFIGLSSIAFISYNITNQNTKNIVKNDMIVAKRNIDIYLKQYFLFNNLEATKTSISSEAEDISNQLSTQMGNTVDIYDLNGKKLSHSSEIAATIKKSDDLEKAINGEISYSTNFVDGKVTVSLSYPIEESNAKIGIIKYNKDYSSLYGFNEKFKNIINLFATLIFVVIFIASFIFARQITKPIKKLTQASDEVSKGNFNIDIDITSKDEIGYLSSRFKMMIEKIKNDRDTIDEVQKQNKLFFDNVTHELKTPITTIMGYAQGIEDFGLKDDEFNRKGLKCIISESNRLNNLVIELLELSKASTKNFNYDFKNVNISELIKETCDEMKIKGRKYNIGIEYFVKDELFLKADRNRLKEVLINLIDNSIKYGNVNSTINVKAYKEEKYIFIIIKDIGEGISEEFIDKIFDPFYRISKNVSSERGSSGLGMSIVKGIVEKHNGNIEIKSKLKEGTEVILRFEGDVL
ncbi:sensor histidine kinase [Clostridium akagii]|uniref:sensor histidine kinase n=1 Tax=Clostridium akagii TaxID=91623 RepID=UPI00047D1BAD|nr:HAMP domain-containing sensor histidine kinase [Clostridium akagii]